MERNKAKTYLYHKIMILSFFALFSLIELCYADIVSETFEIEKKSSWGKPDTVVTVTFCVPEVKIDDDTLMIILESDIYPMFEQLDVHKPKTIHAKRYKKYHVIRFIDSLERCPVEVIEQNGNFTFDGIIGYIQYNDIYVFLSKEFSKAISEYGKYSSFDLKVIHSRCLLPCEEDWWERWYECEDSFVYRFGYPDINGSEFLTKSYKELLEGMYINTTDCGQKNPPE